VMFVGTKKQAQDSIEEACAKTGHPYVTHRWMGGMLTNFQVIQRRLRRLQELRVMRDKGDFQRMGNKEANVHEDDLTRLEHNFSGMVEMRRIPGAMFVIDCKKEHLAIIEAKKLGIPIIALTDTNVDPEPISYPIPGNDDAIRSVKLMVTAISDAILEGQRMLGEREMSERVEAELAEREAKAAEEKAAAAEAAAPKAREEVAVAAGGGEEES
jgi:small subunit ribosomal protein S2